MGGTKCDFLPSCDRRGENQRVAFSTSTLLSNNFHVCSALGKGEVLKEGAHDLIFSYFAVV